MLSRNALFCLGLALLSQRVWSSPSGDGAQGPSLPKELREFTDQVLRDQAYQGMDWVELSKYDFFPRELYKVQAPVEDDIEDLNALESDEASDEFVTATPTEGDHKSPSRTIPNIGHNLAPRDTFTYSCPTSVQCDNGGCCPLGDYCAIRNGELGCCPIGSECDASPIPGCDVSCYGICCDVVMGLIGEKVCSSTTGQGGQASGICTGVEPSSPLYTPVGCSAGEL